MTLAGARGESVPSELMKYCEMLPAVAFTTYTNLPLGSATMPRGPVPVATVAVAWADNVPSVFTILGHDILREFGHVNIVPKGVARNTVGARSCSYAHRRSGEGR